MKTEKEYMTPKEAIEILKHIGADMFMDGDWYDTDYSGRRPASGWLNMHNPIYDIDFRVDQLLVKSNEFIANGDYSDRRDFDSLNAYPLDEERYTESTGKERIIHLFNDMIKAGY